MFKGYSPPEMITGITDISDFNRSVWTVPTLQAL
jgi:hypothetical protein